jgi:hypothetical protein
MNPIFNCILLLFSSFCISAQDEIQTSSGETIKGRIVGISDSEISYRTENRIDAPVYKLEKSKVTGIKIDYSAQMASVESGDPMSKKINGYNTDPNAPQYFYFETPVQKPAVQQQNAGCGDAFGAFLALSVMTAKVIEKTSTRHNQRCNHQNHRNGRCP